MIIIVNVGTKIQVKLYDFRCFFNKKCSVKTLLCILFGLNLKQTRVYTHKYTCFTISIKDAHVIIF